jgi:hypothetical protein
MHSHEPSHLHIRYPQGRGYLSFDEFRRAVRRANIKTNVISDEELQDVVLVVDADGSGQIDVEEFLSFLKPEDIPDVKARASSWTDNEVRGPLAAPAPENLVVFDRRNQTLVTWPSVSGLAKGNRRVLASHCPRALNREP